MHIPTIVRQMGKVTGENRVYIEDYVYTYLSELKKENHGLPVRVALYGHAFSREDIHFYLIYGASCIVEEMERGRNQEDIQKAFFDEYSLIGYVNIYEKQELPGTEEGCCIFYEANEAMQNYLISCYRSRSSGKEKKNADLRAVSMKKGAKEKNVSVYIKEVLRKIFLSFTAILAAVAAAIISDYNCMYDFTMMAVRALQKAG